MNLYMSYKGPFIYKVTGGLGEFMGGHLKNFSLLGGVKGKKLDANGGAKVKR